MSNLPINEIVSLIEDYAPNELIRIKKDFPNNEKLLQVGQTLGEGDDRTLIVKMSVCTSGLRIIIEKCKELMPKIKRQIDRIYKLQLVSQIVVALSGAAIISTLQQDGFGWLKYLSSILVLIGSIIGIYVQHTSNSIYNNSSLFSIYSNLNENYLQAEQHLLDLEIMSQLSTISETSKNELKQIIQNANTTSIQIRKIISHYS